MDQIDEITQRVHYEEIGRQLMTDINVLYADEGVIRTMPLLYGVVLTLSLRRHFIIGPDIQPIYNVHNQYIGFDYKGKKVILEKEKKLITLRSIISTGLLITCGIIVGLTGTWVTILALIIVVFLLGYQAIKSTTPP